MQHSDEHFQSGGESRFHIRAGLTKFKGWSARQIKRHKAIILLVATVLATWFLGGLLIEAVIMGSIGGIIAVYGLLALFIIGLYDQTMQRAYVTTKNKVSNVRSARRAA